MPKNTFLQIRLAPEDRERLRRVAESEHLDASTWARQVLLRALDAWKGQEHPQSNQTLSRGEQP